MMTMAIYVAYCLSIYTTMVQELGDLSAVETEVIALRDITSEL